MVKPDPSSRRRPLSYARAGTSWQIINPTATPAGPCNATFGSCDAEDRQRRELLLLSALRLLRCLLRRCFRLSLLRHCCPPSLSGWRHTVQSRIDVHWHSLTPPKRKKHLSRLILCIDFGLRRLVAPVARSIPRHLSENFRSDAIFYQKVGTARKCP